MHFCLCEGPLLLVKAFSLGYRVFKHIFDFANITFSRQNHFRLCDRRFRSVKAFSPFRGTFSGFRSLIAFSLVKRNISHLQTLFSLGKTVFAFASDVFAGSKLRSEDFAHKRENPSTVLIRPSQRRKYAYQAKTCPGKAEPFLSRESDTSSRKSVSRAKSFNERKRRSQRR